ncbi:MAG: DUF58 domain-containing protein [Clostridiaceae bacterium]|nr:DUF58 domain-containing protein [Clostridiaceae bacterium]
MKPGELNKKIRRIEITSRKLVEESFTGDYRSGFRGKGMEFDSIRQYYPGDDVRNIDWNVSARQNKVFVKQFCEEREMNLFLLIDMSGSNNFGNKKDIIAELGAMLAFTACMNNDKVGAVLFTKKVEKFIPSKNGREHVLAIIENILEFEPESSETSISEALKFFGLIEKKKSIVFIISDFLDQGYEKDLKIISKRHDLILVRVIDRAEQYIPHGAVFAFEDLETGEIVELNSIGRELRLEEQEMKGRNVITVYTDEDYIDPFRQFFRRRARR